MRRFKFIALAALIACLSTQALAEAKTPRQVVDETVDKVLATLKKAEYQDPQKRKELRAEIRDILLSVVDIDKVGELALANYKSKFSDAEYKQFLDVFSNLLFTTYINNIEKYQDEKIVVLKEEIAAGRAVIQSKVVVSSGDIPIDYSLYQSGETWRVYDMKIEGVSLVKNYRSQFREILLKRSAAQFIAQLQDKVAENEKNL
ncbi:MAG: putative phospholipid-binding protein MlaC precursor [candidate division BRC1 bacterium ADurb.BinA364]|nr:MAG: putative phospholipid-binding protein MlaC precursor [candidate division BRC1 bacterium ADurb.BinA364]